MQALSYTFRGEREGGEGASVGIWYAGVLVGKTMGASGVMCDFSFSFQMAPGVMLCDFFFLPSFFMESTRGEAHLRLEVRTRLFF